LWPHQHPTMLPPSNYELPAPCDALSQDILYWPCEACWSPTGTTKSIDSSFFSNFFQQFSKKLFSKKINHFICLKIFWFFDFWIFFYFSDIFEIFDFHFFDFFGRKWSKKSRLAQLPELISPSSEGIRIKVRYLGLSTFRVLLIAHKKSYI